MSRQNVELVQRSWKAWIRGDLDGAFAEAHPDFEWNLSHFPGWPDGEVFQGRDAVRGFFELWVSSWDSYEAGVEEFVDLGDDRVLTLCWQRGRGRESGAVAEMDWAQIYTLRNGQIVRCDNYAERAEALEAAGLSEGPGS
jgi:ketosteroid isomerase-like protein